MQLESRRAALLPGRRSGVSHKNGVSATSAIRGARERCAEMGRAGLLVADEFGRSARSTLQDARAWRTGKERHVPENERIFMINGAASCVEVQGGVADPAVLLVGSSMLSWPNELCDRLVAGGRRVIRYGPPTSSARRPTSPSPTTARAGASGPATSPRPRTCCTG